MHICRLSIKNFRLLEDVDLCLEKRTTLIVGRNNSGKTSLTEFFRRVLAEDTPRFKLEDFSLGVHERFWEAFEMHRSGTEEVQIRKVLPEIIAELVINYDDDADDFGPLSNFVIDLNKECTTTLVNIRYALAPGKIQEFFADLTLVRENFFKDLKERIPMIFKTTIEAEDPNDPSNVKVLDFSTLKALLQFNLINAQRAIDDATRKEKAVIGKVLESLFRTAGSAAASQTDRDIATDLKDAVSVVQDEIDTSFNAQLTSLIPTFNLFGYPGLSDPMLRTETVLKVEQLLSDHTTVGYEGVNGVNLPESYNGLGTRNLIFILLKLFEFFKAFTIKQPASGIHLIFIEEPEAHLHPQMQNVFIRKIDEIANHFSEQFNDGNPWPVQFVVTTHSSHIANEASFDSMRYFLAQPFEVGATVKSSIVKDLRSGLSNEDAPNREFLHKYMTLTSCDLLFADRAVLIEGATERLLLPTMIKKIDAITPETAPKLGSQYISIMEVGGAHAHRFFNLLDFLNLRTLIITDLDTVKQVTKKDKAGKNIKRWVKCLVFEGERTSNSCIKGWFSTDVTKDELFAKTETEKTTADLRLAFQVPHAEGFGCGRSFEDAFMLANPYIFGISGDTTEEREKYAGDKAFDVDKTDFALEHAILNTKWTVPRYIEEGVKMASRESCC